MLTTDELVKLRSYLEEAMATEGDRSVKTDKPGESIAEPRFPLLASVASANLRD